MVGVRVHKLISAFSPRMMLIDEDKSFGKKFIEVARRLNLKIDRRTDIVDIYRNPPIEPDILILSYELGRVNGVQLSRYLEHHARASFVILLIEGGLEQLQIRLPPCVKAVISKDSTSEHILNVTKNLFKCYRSTEI